MVMVLVIGWIKAKKVNSRNTRLGAKTTLPALRATLWWGRRQSSSRWHLVSLKSGQCALLIKRQTEFFEADWETVICHQVDLKPVCKKCYEKYPRSVRSIRNFVILRVLPGIFSDSHIQICNICYIAQPRQAFVNLFFQATVEEIPRIRVRKSETSKKLGKEEFLLIVYFILAC